jgi:hypothetical protein
VDWFQDHVVGLSAGAWTALAAWLAVLVGVAALVYASRQYRRAREEAAELTQPQVAMFMEPSASDWHLIELVVKNFGRTPAYGIRFEFANPPTVGKYENSYEDQYVDIMPLNLPAEIPTWRRHRVAHRLGFGARPPRTGRGDRVAFPVR